MAHGEQSAGAQQGLAEPLCSPFWLPLLHKPPGPGIHLLSLQVFFSRDQSRAQLVIDGLRAQSAAVATAELFVAQTPLYVGGVPDGRAKAHMLVRAFAGPLASLHLYLPLVPQHCPMSPHAHSQGLSLQGTSVSSFDGCLRNPQLDGKPLGTPSHTFGVTPCYEGALESGVFFAADGGSITLGNPQQPGLVPMVLGLERMCLVGGPLSPSHQWHCISS